MMHLPAKVTRIDCNCISKRIAILGTMRDLKPIPGLRDSLETLSLC